MIVTIDANFLAMILHPDARPPIDPGSKEPLQHVRVRMESLVNSWNEQRCRVVVPMPALAEFLVLAHAQANEYLSDLNNLAYVSLRPFDLRAAVELASMEWNARRVGNKRGPVDSSVPWQKVKVDRQILAIAKVSQASILYTDDASLAALTRSEGLKVISSWELPEPVGLGVPHPGTLFDNSTDGEAN